MDSQHRHELKTNELADWMTHVPEFFREHGRTIAGIILIVLALISWPLLKKMRQTGVSQQQADTTRLVEQIETAKVMALRNLAQKEQQGMFVADMLMGAANELKINAAGAKSPQYSAMALINQAEAIRADIHYRAEPAGQEQINIQIEQAEKAYQEAIEKAQDNTTLSAMANYGLGLCAEERGDFEKAARIYRQIQDNADFAGTLFPAGAAYRLEMLKDNSIAFVFVDAPKPEIPDQPAAVNVDEKIPAEQVKKEAAVDRVSDTEAAPKPEQTTGTETSGTAGEAAGKTDKQPGSGQSNQ